MSLSVFTHQITGPENTAKAFFLDGTAISSSNVALDLVGGTAQSLNGDFGVDSSGTRIRWNTPYALSSQLATNDIVRVIYDRS